MLVFWLEEPHTKRLLVVVSEGVSSARDMYLSTQDRIL